MVSQSEETPVNELDDFEAFLEPDFKAEQFANELLVATNGQDNPELDLTTPIKKLTFDIDECDKRIAKISSSNYESLIANFQQIAECKQILTTRLNPSLDRVNAPFQRIKKEVIEPYDEAVKLNNALKRIHLTLELLRNTSFFIFIIQQVEELTSSLNDKDLVRLAKLHIQIKQLYENASQEKGNEVNVLSIKIVRDYQSNAVTRRTSLIKQCSSVVSGDFNHLSTLEYKNQKLRAHLSALYILDKTEFFDVFDRSTIARQVQSGTAQLTRALQSPRNFTAIMSEVKEASSEYFGKLTDVLGNWSTGTDDENTTLLSVVLDKYGVESLLLLFWVQLNQKFKKNIVASMARGGPIAKNLRVYSKGISASVLEMFKSEKERELLLDSLAMIDYK
ncbi:Conserved oligomeric Golgi complex subunit 5 [Candida viswanathii]|uniref:Conserved oligomeric Golgi complex subunit 5 n=1 Tax=Candida viswanathii TaxID=5486 RepID=A0A367Y4K3_9ASCO|nr:Conserved oligomeric Golgi complex subunit 5 [Candida viswanathii]